MSVLAMFIPAMFVGAFSYAGIKRVKVFDSFVSGVKKAPPLILSVFPYMACVFMITELLTQSGIMDKLVSLVSPAFSFLGIPKEIAGLMIIKPFSGSGALSALSDVISACGADSYAARCAAVCYASSDTTFYVAAVYFAGSRTKKFVLPVAIALFSSFVASVFGCFILRFL